MAEYLINEYGDGAQATRAVLASAHYVKHVMAMTTENLHAKSDIAVELARRDMKIEELRKNIHDVREEILDLVWQ